MLIKATNKNNKDMKKIFTLLALVLTMTLAAYAETVTSPVTIYTYANGTDTMVCNPYETTVSYEDGVYTLQNFLWSECPFSFRLQADPENGSYGAIELLPDTFSISGENLYYWLIDPALLEQDGDDYYNGIWLDNYYDSGQDEFMYYPTIYNDSTFTFTYYSSADNEKPWYVNFCFDAQGWLEESQNWAWIWFDASFYMPDLSKSASAVESLGASDEAPVYRNLQGVRVANPEKGVFLKTQGGKIVKVIR